MTYIECCRQSPSFPTQSSQPAGVRILDLLSGAGFDVPSAPVNTASGCRSLAAATGSAVHCRSRHGSPV